MLEFDEALPQDFTFIGQWGVTADRELRDIFWMRSRHYDAQLGRFLSIDPLGKSAFNKYYKPSDIQKMVKFKIETVHIKVYICSFIFMQIKLIFICSKCFS